MPIVVVDVAALDPTREKICLIQRDTPAGLGWNLIGGRILRGQTLGGAIRHQVETTLGNEVAVDVRDDQQPDYIAQYGPFDDAVFSPDPRKHAVGLTYALVITGTPRPHGEAKEISWFPLEALPARREWGFEQDRPAEACLQRAGLKPKFAGG